MASIPVVRDTIHAGLMYPDDKQELRRLLATYLNGQPEPERCLRAMVSPHAALTYAGPIMASVWSQVCHTKTEKVVIISDLHPKTARTLFSDNQCGILLTQADYFTTPLGAVPVDQELCSEIEACSTLVTISDAAHEEESSIELQTLFSVYLLPGVPIVPILIFGSNDIPVQTLARSMDYLFPEPVTNTIFVAACNMGIGSNAQIAGIQQQTFTKIIQENDIDKLWQYHKTVEHASYNSLSLAVLLSMKLLKNRKRKIIMTADSSLYEQNTPHCIVNYGSAGWFDE